MKQRTFVEMSYMGNADESNTERSSVRPRGTLELLQSLTFGREVSPPDAPITVQIDGDQPLEDMPWSHMVPVVSERFREFVARWAPGHAQFFPVRLEGPAKLLPKVAYYVVNWTKSLSAIDMTKSVYHRRPLYKGSDKDITSFDSIVIDERSVPENVWVFRPKEYSILTVVDAAWAREVKTYGLTGLQFYKLDRRR